MVGRALKSLICEQLAQDSESTRKCDEMNPKTERNRCAWPDDLNLLITRSRNLVS